MSTTEPQELDEPYDEPDEPIEFEPPDLKSSRFGIVGEFLKYRQTRKKRRGLLSKGYVQWYLIDDSFPKPKFIKPKQNGGGIPEYKHKGVRYLFPKDGMVPSDSQGFWTVVHRKGEADPINLRDPSKLAIPADVLDEYLQMRTTASPPSFFDKFNFDPDELLKYAIVGIIVIAVGHAVLTGVLF